MILFPNAKINLGLNVLSRRSDGYHEVETVMYPIGWTDVLEITPLGEGHTESRLTLSGNPVECPPEKNLVMKALRCFETITGRKALVDIRLHKVIPDGAGLGGGSSDAAFTLVGLNKVLATSLSTDRLAEMAATIGADCPFFIYNRPMLATGIGTNLQPVDVDLRGTLLAVVKPGESVSTAAAYAGVTPFTPAVCCGSIATTHPVDRWQGELVNDFEPSVFNQCAVVAEVKHKLQAMNPVYCSMSGSGSAVYALFNGDRMSAELMRQLLEEQFPSMAVHAEHLQN